jgi:hypothetical protein
MPRDFLVSDTASQHGAVAACSGASAGVTVSDLEIGGTAGTGTRTCEPGTSFALTRCDHFETASGGTGETDWGSAGAGNNDWIVRRNVTTGRTVTWEETYICERTTGGTYNTVVSETGQAIDMSSAGLKTHTLEANDFTAGSTGSQIYIVCVDQGPDHGNDAVVLTNGETITTPLPAPAAYDQDAYRGRGDTVGLNTNTWDNPLNTGWNQLVDTVFRVRFLIQETAGASATQAWKLQYNLAGAGWNDVTASSPIQWALSGQYADDDTTSQLLGAGTFRTGHGNEGDNLCPDTGGVSIQGNDETENEWALSVDSGQVTHTQTFQLRVVESDGTELGSYTNTPTITVNEPFPALTVPVLKVHGLGTKINWSDPFSQGLEGLWLLNEGLGTQLYDLTGKGHDATFQGTLGGIRSEVGPDGLGQGLGGLAAERFNVPNHPQLTVFSELTLLVWLEKEDDPPGAVDGSLIAKDFPSASEEYQLEIKNSSLFPEFHARVGAAVQSVTGTVAISNGKVIMVGSFNGGEASNNAHLVVNGEVVGTGSWGSGTTDAGDPGDTIWLAGNENNTDRRIPGTYYLFAIWRRYFPPNDLVKLSRNPYRVLARGDPPLPAFLGSIPTTRLSQVIASVGA